MSSGRLAIEGGSPARSRPDTDRAMRIGALQIDDAERLRVDKVLRSQILDRYKGGYVAELESQFANWLGPQSVQCLAVNSGTSALLLAFAALNLEPGSEVLVPTMGFVSIATAILAAGGVPRFVPVDRSLGMNPEAAASLVTNRTRALLAVHFYGSACDLAALQLVVNDFDGVLIEDVAQACGTTFQGRRLGTFGLLSCFSFQYYKLLTTGEGGMLVTSDTTLFNRASFIHDASALWTMPERSMSVERVNFPPLNLRMSEIEGTLGLAQLSKCDDSLLRLRTIKAALRNHLANRSGIMLRPHPDLVGEMGSTLVFYLEDQQTAQWVVKAMQAEGVNVALLLGEVGTNRHWAGNWLSILERCGYHLDMEAHPANDPFGLAQGVVFPIDLRYSQRDVDETIEAFVKVLDKL